MTAPKSSTVLNTIERLRLAYGYPLDDGGMEWGDYKFDHHQCSLVAEKWVFNGGTPENFRAADELIARLIRDGFEQDDDEPREYAFARQWREAGGDVEDFQRLLKVIEGHVFDAMPWSYRKAVVCGK